jgi:hypothetical protein
MPFKCSKVINIVIMPVKSSYNHLLVLRFSLMLSMLQSHLVRWDRLFSFIVFTCLSATGSKTEKQDISQQKKAVP